MDDATHTPAPWVIDAAYPSEVQAEGGKTIASCWHQYAVDAVVTLNDVLPCTLEESAANARLIAAAPDLLHALQVAITRADATLPNFSGRSPECQADYDLAVTAIAKAIGTKDAQHGTD